MPTFKIPETTSVLNLGIFPKIVLSVLGMAILTFTCQHPSLTFLQGHDLSKFHCFYPYKFFLLQYYDLLIFYYLKYRYG